MSVITERELCRMQPASQTPDYKAELFAEVTGRLAVIAGIVVVVAIAVGII